MIVVLAAIIGLAVEMFPAGVAGLEGICWKTNVRGQCRGMLKMDVTREQCCGTKDNPPLYGATTLSWSPNEDLFEKDLFFWFAVAGGSPSCSSCQASCQGVTCPEGKKCRMRHGVPKCVCHPPCSRKLRNQGPVCGSDGVTYRHVCRLRRVICRTSPSYQVKNYSASHTTLYDFAGFHDTVGIAYYGICRNTCEGVVCPGSRRCVVDQTLTPHCLECGTFRCSHSYGQGRVCGADGVTYPSACHLRNAACERGYSVPLAYHGPCNESATCGTMKCAAGRKCLVEPQTGRPRCTTCHGHGSPWLSLECSHRIGNKAKSRRRRRDGGDPICASDGETYESWCHMKMAACVSGVGLDAVYRGRCKNATDSPLVPEFKLKHPPDHSPQFTFSSAFENEETNDVPGKIKWSYIRP